MYSFHSSPEEKNKLLYSLTQYGIETTVDRGAKKDRIRAWIENSIIDEEEEEEEERSDTDNEELRLLDNETGPVGERMDRGPIAATRITRQAGKTMDDKQKRREIRDSMINKRNSAIYIPPVDPRIPLEQQRRAKSETQLSKPPPEPVKTIPPPNKYFEKFSSKIATDLNGHDVKKNDKTIATTQTSNESNNSAQSDDSTIVNVQDKPQTKNHKPQVVAMTQTSNPYVNSHYNHVNNYSRSENKTYTSRYDMKTPMSKGRYSSRHNYYDSREEKSSSSISNSTGRSISK